MKMISIKNTAKGYLISLYSKTLIFWAMGGGSHYEFWLFAQPGLRTQPRYEAPGDLQVKYVRTQ